MQKDKSPEREIGASLVGVVISVVWALCGFAWLWLVIVVFQKKLADFQLAQGEFILKDFADFQFKGVLEIVRHSVTVGEALFFWTVSTERGR